MVRQVTLSWKPILRDLIFYSISILLLLAVFAAIAYSVVVVKLAGKYNVYTLVTYQNAIGVLLSKLGEGVIPPIYSSLVADYNADKNCWRISGRCDVFGSVNECGVTFD